MPGSAIARWSDPYDCQQSLRAADVEVVVSQRGAFRAEAIRVDLQQIWMQCGWTSLPYIAWAAMHSGRIPFMFRAETERPPFSIGGRELAPDDVAFFAPEAEFHLRAMANASWSSISLPPEGLAEAGRILVGRDITPPSTTQLLRVPPHIRPRLNNLHASTTYLASTAPDILAHPAVATALDQAMTVALVRCLSAGEATASREEMKRGSVMRRFEQIIEANPDRPLYIAELCKEVGITDRRLRQNLQEVLGMTPIATWFSGACT